MSFFSFFVFCKFSSSDICGSGAQRAREGSICFQVRK